MSHGSWEAHGQIRQMFWKGVSQRILYNTFRCPVGSSFKGTFVIYLKRECLFKTGIVPHCVCFFLPAVVWLSCAVIYPGSRWRYLVEIRQGLWVWLPGLQGRWPHRDGPSLWPVVRGALHRWPCSRREMLPAQDSPTFLTRVTPAWPCVSSRSLCWWSSPDSHCSKPRPASYCLS